MRFDPPAATFARVVEIACLPPIQLPTALGVDRQGNPYIAGISIDRQLLRIDAVAGACHRTGFEPNLAGFGIAFSMEPRSGGDTLYAIEDGELASLDTSTFNRMIIGPVGVMTTSGSGSAGTASFLTGTSAGDLFTTYPLRLVPSSPPAQRSRSQPGMMVSPPIVSIGEVSKSTGAVTDRWSLTLPATGPSQIQAFAFWGGDFYFFVMSGAGTAVWRFRPSDGSTVQVAQTPEIILAAGVSTCAPIR
ncbi:MAG: hypothetical protein M3O46_01715 [Myxococcota bacterium]|nr:hypothetical protein [Myxococcota bacterium]